MQGIWTAQGTRICTRCIVGADPIAMADAYPGMSMNMPLPHGGTAQSQATLDTVQSSRPVLFQSSLGLHSKWLSRDLNLDIPGLSPIPGLRQTPVKYLLIVNLSPSDR